jgi:hypothetical protein
MRDWLSVRKEYLRCIFSLEGPIGDRRCSGCGIGDGSWRCLDCLSRPLFCISCCRQAHSLLPFHRVERWTGSHFTPAWLQDVGVAIHLGHQGKPCPSVAEFNVYGYEDDWEDEEEFSPLPEHIPQPPGSLDSNGNPIMVITDRSGIHHIGVKGCSCPNAKTLDFQLLEMGIYPASQKRPKTGFTFSVLDDYLIDNRECKVTALRYFSKLRRVTNNAFPASAPVGISLYRWRDTSHKPDILGSVPRATPSFTTMEGSEIKKMAQHGVQDRRTGGW